MGIFIQEGGGIQTSLNQCTSQNELTENDIVLFTLQRKNVLHLDSQKKGNLTVYGFPLEIWQAAFDLT